MNEARDDEIKSYNSIIEECEIFCFITRDADLQREQHAQRLEDIETLIFPPQVFVSTGCIVKHQTCSICGSEYGECEHLAGRPYFGEFCAIVAGDLEVNHVAIVKNAADKGCRITHFSVAGGERNRMTWKVEPTRHESNEPNPENPGLGAQAVIRRLTA
jgi:hypothetical protein